MPVGTALGSSIEIRPETELLFLLARTRLSPAAAARVTALLDRELDWIFLVRDALSHDLLHASGDIGLTDDAVAPPAPVIGCDRDRAAEADRGGILRGANHMGGGVPGSPVTQGSRDASLGIFSGSGRS